MFQIDKDLSALDKGVWTEWSGSSFLIAHISNMKFQRALSRLQQPHRRKIEQGTIPSAEFVFLRQSLRRHITQALGDLDEKEERVLRLRFGLDGSDPKTLKEIGEMMNLSRERIRQIEAQALDKLNRSQKCHQLRGYLN